MAADRRMMATPDTMPAFPRIDAPAGFNVRIDNVVKAYGRHEVLKGISLEVHAGECVALLGPNGAGKTTLFKLILGLVRPGGGQVSIDGMDPAARAFRAYRSEIGFLPENVSFHQAMTGQEVLAFYARLKGASASECPILLERVGLADVAKRRVGTYSKGMRQRLGLAQALLGNPRLLILDEPTTGLDPALRRQFFDILRGFSEAGVTVIISSHALTEIEARADRYAIVHGGKLAAFGTLTALQEGADLPVRIRLSLEGGNLVALAQLVGDRGTVNRAPAGHAEVVCAPGEKVPLMRDILGSDLPIGDVEVRSSRLEDIYAYHATQEVDQ